jgi:hypothetical protein
MTRCSQLPVYTVRTRGFLQKKAGPMHHAGNFMHVCMSDDSNQDMGA